MCMYIITKLYCRVLYSVHVRTVVASLKPKHVMRMDRTPVMSTYHNMPSDLMMALNRSQLKARERSTR